MNVNANERESAEARWIGELIEHASVLELERACDALVYWAAEHAGAWSLVWEGLDAERKRRVAGGFVRNAGWSLVSPSQALDAHEGEAAPLWEAACEVAFGSGPGSGLVYWLEQCESASTSATAPIVRARVRAAHHSPTALKPIAVLCRTMRAGGGQPDMSQLFEAVQLACAVAGPDEGGAPFVTLHPPTRAALWARWLYHSREQVETGIATSNAGDAQRSASAQNARTRSAHWRAYAIAQWAQAVQDSAQPAPKGQLGSVAHGAGGAARERPDDATALAKALGDAVLSTSRKLTTPVRSATDGYERCLKALIGWADEGAPVHIDTIAHLIKCGAGAPDETALRRACARGRENARAIASAVGRSSTQRRDILETAAKCAAAALASGARTTLAIDAFKTEVQRLVGASGTEHALECAARGAAAGSAPAREALKARSTSTQSERPLHDVVSEEPDEESAAARSWAALTGPGADAVAQLLGSAHIGAKAQSAALCASALRTLRDDEQGKRLEQWMERPDTDPDTRRDIARGALEGAQHLHWLDGEGAAQLVDVARRCGVEEQDIRTLSTALKAFADGELTTRIRIATGTQPR